MSAPNPYVGPRSFESGEVLYGRDREVRSLAALLIAERLVLLHSPSGAGKTSLLQAGLLPRLQSENFNVLPLIRVNIEPPPRTPANRFVLSTLLSLEEGRAPEQRLPPGELAGLSLEVYLSRRAPEGDTLLVFDQFEEVLTLAAADREGKQAFFTQLGQALRNKRRWALFAMREDFLGALAPYLRPIPNRMETRFRLDLLGTEAAIQAVQKPAKTNGVDFSAAAAQKLVDDLRRVQVQLPDGTLESQLGPYVEPVQLQVVCYRLWESRDMRRAAIDEADLAEVGDVNQSLAEYYALSVGRVAQASGATERSVREWFDRKLITPDGLRGQVRMGAEASEGLSNDAVRRLEDAHIIRAEKRAGQTWYELSHDRLIEPVRADNQAWFTANLSLFQRQAGLWAHQGRSEGLLFRGQELAAAEQEAQALTLTADETTFLDACRRLKQREDRDRLRNRVITFLAIGATIAMLAAGVLWVQAQTTAQANARLAQENGFVAATAQVAKEAAVNAQATAQVNAAAALSAQATAQVNEDIAQAALATQSAQTDVISKQTREIVARSLGVAAQALANSNQQLALLLSLYGVQETKPDGFIHLEVNRALNAVLDSHLLLSFEGQHTGPIYSAALAEDQNLLVTASPSDKKLILWNTADGSVERELPMDAPHLEKNPPALNVLDVAVNPQGTQVVALDAAYGEIDFYDAVAGTLQRQIIDGKDVAEFPGFGVPYPYPTVVRYSPDGSLIVVGFDDGSLRLYDPATQAQIANLNNRVGRYLVSALAFNAAGTQLAVGYSSGLIETWDLAARRLITAIPGAHQQVLGDAAGWWSRPFDGVTGLAFSPDGQQLASSGNDRMVKVWDLATGQNVKTLLGHAGPVYDVAFGPGGGALISAGDNGELYLWDIARGAIIQRINGHSGAVTRLVLAQAGKRLLSASTDGTVKYWRLDSPTATAQLQIPAAYGATFTQAQPFAFSSKPGLLMVGCYVYDLRAPAASIPDPTLIKDCQVINASAYPEGLVYANYLPDSGNTPANNYWDASLQYLTSPADIKTITSIVTAQPDSRPWSMIPSGPNQMLVISCNCSPGWGLRGDNVWYYDLVDMTTQADSLHLKIPEPLQDTTKRAVNELGEARPRAVTPDGQQLILSVGAKLYVLGIQSNQVLHELDLQGVVNDAVLSPDGQRLLTASSDGLATIWDYATLTPVVVLRGHLGAVTQARFLNNGATVITAGEDGSVRFWEADSGRVTRLIQDHTGPINFMAVSDDGQTLITLGGDRNLYVYSLGQNLLEQAAQRLTRGDLTAEECAKYLSRTDCKLEALSAAP